MFTDKITPQLMEQERLVIEVTEAIAIIMKHQDISYSDLAKRIGKNTGFVRKILGGKPVSLRMLSNIFLALNHRVHITVSQIEPK